MHQRGLAAVSLAAVTLCTAVCGGGAGSTKITDQARLSTTTRTDGKTQIVYNGHPPYDFEGD
ncbi:hypothetical protein [Streptomyces sp. NRRL B-24572]|uniref:hypothetical protein n=1 Tax=Streptomyces sp. NRRL B-24572 TaxID=1962156 RepID=UPI000A379CF1|nr:hypothetical protein [Streptomyces sp. NRRL B-24572]